MEEAGADTSVVKTFIDNLSNGNNVHQELENSRIPSYAREFVSNTIASLDKSTPYVASQFLKVSIAASVLDC